MRGVLTSGTKLELIWSAERRWFTLPAVNCHARSRSKPLVESSSHYSSRQACSPQTRNESDFRWLKKILIDEAEVDVEVLPCRFLFLSKQRLCEDKPSGNEALLLSARKKFNKEKKNNLFLPPHPHLHFKGRKINYQDCGMSSANPSENTQTKSHPNNAVLMLMKSLGTRRLTGASG